MMRMEGKTMVAEIFCEGPAPVITEIYWQIGLIQTIDNNQSGLSVAPKLSIHKDGI